MFWVSYVLLWAVVLLLAVVVAVLVQQRVPGLPSGWAGAIEGTIAPNLVGRTVEDDEEILVDMVREAPLVVVFLAMACEPCWEVRDAIAEVAGTRVGHVRFVVCCVGDHEDVCDFATALGTSPLVLADGSGRNAEAWGIRRHPTAVGVDRRGKVQGSTHYLDVANLETLADRLAAGEVRILSHADR